MKSYFATLAVFGVLLAGMLTNAAYIDRTTAEMSERIDSLPSFDAPSSEQELEEIIALWQQKQRLVCLSTPLESVESVTDCFRDMEHARKNGDGAEYEVARSRASNLIRRIARLERLNWGTVF